MATHGAKVRLSGIASRQWGRVGWWQLRRRARLPTSTINRWLKQGYLYRIHPRVYGVGHRAPSVEGDLAAALLYAGPGAMLSHGTAAWWWRLIDNAPSTIHVSTSRRCRSLPGVRVHQRRECKRIWHKQMPVTSVAQTLVDYAGGASLNSVRKALANAEYRALLDVAAVRALIGRGRAGSSKLRQALKRHEPRLAHTRSPVEDKFLALCESAGIELPEVNVLLEGWAVDAFWPGAGLAVELDGYGNHHTRAQTDRDRRKEMCLRNVGLTVARYSEDQIENEPDAVIADISATLERLREERARRASS